MYKSHVSWVRSTVLIAWKSKLNQGMPLNKQANDSYMFSYSNFRPIYKKTEWSNDTTGSEDILGKVYSDLIVSKQKLCCEK